MNEENNEPIVSPKSPKSPKLSEEISELNLSNNINENEENEFSNDPVIEKVLKQLISNSPVGEVQQVSTLCTELFPKYNKLIEEELNAKMSHDGYILDGKLIIAEDDNDLNDGIEDPFGIELNEKVEGYVKELFPGTGAFKVVKKDESTWIIHIVGQRMKPKAYWSGHWRSTWTVKFIQDDQGEEAKCFKFDGNIGITVHYHEEGNVQLSANKEIPSRVNFKAESLSKAVEKIYYKIKDSEDTVQLALNEAYKELAESMFKKLKRQLPVTRTKMDWSKFTNYKLSNELKK